MGVRDKKNCCFCRKDGPPSFLTKAGLGMAAGCVGAFVGTPAEVALIRMTADGRLPLGEDIFFIVYVVHIDSQPKV